MNTNTATTQNPSEAAAANLLPGVSKIEIGQETAMLNGTGRYLHSGGPGYAATAACHMVATRCACCAYPLVEVESVELGLGPDCAAKYGKPSAASVCNPAEVTRLLGLAVKADPMLDSARVAVETHLATSSAQKAANVLVYHIAAHQKGTGVAYLCAALAALGYTDMAARIGQRLGHITVKPEGTQLVARLPYDPELVAEVARIPGRTTEKRRDAGKKRFYTVNIIPASQAEALWAALKARLPSGSMVLGSKGYRVIPQK